MKYPLKYCIAGCGIEDDGGAFNIPFKGTELHVIASSGGGWNHVSVSTKGRTPSWEQMCHIKDLFFDKEDCVIQYHPPKSKYKNLHKNCLHLWQPKNIEIPMPPLEFV